MIYPRCKADHDQIYVSADGYLLPCCWIGNQPHLDEYQKFLGAELYESCNLKKVSFSASLSGPAQKKIEESWRSTQPFSACKEFCSTRLKEEESTSRQGTNERERLNLA